jgi:hypothetical protein
MLKSPPAEQAPMPILALSFASLRIGGSDLAIDTPAKRKAACSGHYGLANDSSLAVRLVALSRLLRARDDEILSPAAQTPVGVAVLAALRDAVLRVALAVGGADQALTNVQVTTLFNLSASHVATQRLYDSGLSLPSKLPWANAKALLAALLDSLTSARGASVGYRVAQLLGHVPPPPIDTDAQTDIAATMSLIECEMAKRLSTADASSVSSSGSSPPPAQELPALPAPAQPEQQPETPFIVDAGVSLSANLDILVAKRLNRALQAGERAALRQALDEGLSVLQAGGSDARQQLLAASATVALASPGAAQLWACCLEACEGEVASVEALATAITAGCAAVAGLLLANAIGV